jgi:hypothetical protein
MTPRHSEYTYWYTFNGSLRVPRASLFILPKAASCAMPRLPRVCFSSVETSFRRSLSSVLMSVLSSVSFLVSFRSFVYSYPYPSLELAKRLPLSRGESLLALALLVYSSQLSRLVQSLLLVVRKLK